MKNRMTILGLMLTAAAFGQQANVKKQFDQEPTFDRRSVLNATLAFTGTVEETSFWSLYDEYESGIPEAFQCTHTLSSRQGRTSRQCVESVLANQSKEVFVRKDFFARISKATNGKTAFQFLQSEILTDLILKSRIFEAAQDHYPMWNSNLIEDESAKFAVLRSAMHVEDQDISKFESIVADFEFEYSRVVGHALVWFEQYVEDITDFTPAQCVVLGNEFLKMQEDEINLKARYFNIIASSLSEETAARFIALQDYFFNMDKLTCGQKMFMQPDRFLQRYSYLPKWGPAVISGNCFYIKLPEWVPNLKGIEILSQVMSFEA